MGSSDFETPQETPQDAPRDINLTRLGRVISQKRWYILGPMFAALLGATIFVNVVKPRYTADARLILENQENFLTRGDKAERGEQAVAPDPEAVQSQIQLLTSRDLARRAIKALGLQGNEEFDPLAKGVGLVTRALVLLGLARDPTQVPPEERILTTFADRLTVLSPTKTRVLTIEFSSRDPDLSARAANVVADGYLDMQQDAKREQARAAAQSLATQVAEMRRRVSAAESEVEAFRLKSGLLVGANNTTITTQQLADINTQLSQSRATRADALAKAGVLRDMLKQNRIGDVPDIANNELLRRISEQRVSLNGQLAMESRTLLPGHPRIKELQAQLDALDSQWRSAAARTARTLENDGKIAGARVEQLQRTLDEQKKIVGAADADDVHLRELDRAARALKEQLETASTKYQEALARESSRATPADARIIQRALAPQLPSFPKKLPIVGFSTVAALLLSLGVVVAGELLTERAVAPPPPPGRRAPRRDEPEAAAQENVLRRVLPMRVVGAVRAEARDAPEPVAVGGDADAAAQLDEDAGAPCEAGEERNEPDAPAVECFAPAENAELACVTALLVNGDDAQTGVATALALARGLAQRGRAILVCADAGDPAYDRLASAGEEVPKGFSDLVAGDAAFADVIHRDPGSRLHIVAAGAAPAGETAQTEDVLAALAASYDFVVVATASLETAHRLAPAFHSVMLHAPQGRAEQLQAHFAQFGVTALLVDAVSGNQAAA
jgi:polysaccharide biosynthesis transport protein